MCDVWVISQRAGVLIYLISRKVEYNLTISARRRSIHWNRIQTGRWFRFGGDNWAAQKTIALHLHVEWALYRVVPIILLVVTSKVLSGWKSAGTAHHDDDYTSCFVSPFSFRLVQRAHARRIPSRQRALTRHFPGRRPLPLPSFSSSVQLVVYICVFNIAHQVLTD